MIPTTLTIGQGQYLSDVGHKLPTTRGIHLVTGGTGIGKTNHMMAHAEAHKGIVVFPTKAVMAQKQMTYKVINGTVVQLEKLSSIKLVDRRGKPLFGAIHIDETQITYDAGYRESVGELLAVIRRASQIMPVYIYSATVVDHMLPVDLDSRTDVIKKEQRHYTLIRLPAGGVVMNSYKKIGECLRFIRLESAKPVLVFMDNKEKGECLRELLSNHDLTCICLNSENTKDADNERNKDAYNAYTALLKSKSIGATGYDVVIATKTLSAGIDIEDDFHCVSVQAEPGLMFQQQGRVRNVGSHWLITGLWDEYADADASDRLYLHDGCCVMEIDGKTVFVDDQSIASARNDVKYNDEPGTELAYQFMEYADRCQRSKWAASVVKGFESLGVYELAGQLDYEIDVEPKFRSEFKQVHKRVLVGVVREHGIPDSMFNHASVMGHPAYLALVEDHGHQNAIWALEKAYTWFNTLDARLDRCGIKMDIWHAYARLNSHVREVLLQVLSDKHDDLRKRWIESANTMRDIVNQKYSGRVSMEKLGDHCTAFWDGVFGDASEWRFHADENKDSRKALFMMIMGYVPDETHEGSWKLGKDWWDVPLSSAENKRFKDREDHLNAAGVTVGQYCKRHQVDKQAIASIKMKAFKQSVYDPDIDWG